MKYIIIAMGRSGHRYITAWIIKNLTGTVTLYRNCVKGWEKGKLLPYLNKKNHVIVTENEGIGNHEVRTIEDVPITVIKGIEHTKIFRESQIVVVVRDPTNWLASSIQGGGYLDKNLEVCQENIKNTHKRLYPLSRIEAYKTYFDKYYQWFQYITTPYINYKLFSTRAKYRSYFRNQLHLERLEDKIPCDKKLKYGSIYGFSSFDDKGRDSNNRYYCMKESQRDRIDRLMDSEMKEINKDYFGLGA